MKRIIILIMTSCLIACNTEILVPEPAVKSDTMLLTYQLNQMHFVVLRQIEYLICLDDHPNFEAINYKFVDVHLAWLEFSNDSTSNYYPYEITHSITHTAELNLTSPKDLLSQTFTYDNGFKIDTSNLIEVNSQIESFDVVTIPVDGKEVEFSSPELENCKLVALSLKFTDYNSSQINGIITLAFSDTNGNLSETMEFPATFKLI